MWLLVSAAAFGAPTLTTAGTCPGSVDITASGLTPGGRGAFLVGEALGGTALAGGPCPGLVPGIDAPFQAFKVTADGAGEVALSRSLDARFCDRHLVVVDAGSCEASAPTSLMGPFRDITFRVDMGCSGEAFGTVYVAGPWNGWTDANPMRDPDGDGIWELTLPFAAGAPVEYLFMVDNWAAREDLIDDALAGGSCVGNTDYATYANRLLTADDDTVTADVWGRCGDCAEPVFGCTDPDATNFTADATHDNRTCAYEVTFQLDLNDRLGTFTTPYVTGGAIDGWCGSCTPLTDGDGDGIYTTTVALPRGAFDFKYTLDGWGGLGETLSVDTCTTDFYGYVNRHVDVGASPTVLAPAPFEGCPATTAPVTFVLDGRCGGLPAGTPYVTGPFDGWCGNCNALTESAPGVWTATVDVPVGHTEYKFTVDGWATQEALEPGSSCTLTTGTFTNRLLRVGGAMTAPTARWQSCGGCDPIGAGFDVDVAAGSFVGSEIFEEHVGFQLGDTWLDDGLAHTDGGVCQLPVTDDGGGGFLGTQIATFDEVGFGSWTARLSGPTQPGTVCAFFGYDATAPDYGCGYEAWVSNEFDFEIVDGRVLVGTYADWRPCDGFEDGATSSVDGHVAREALWWTPPPGFDLTAMHDYRFEWGAGQITFWIDDMLIDTITAAVPQDDVELMVNHWTASHWDGFPPASLPVEGCAVDAVWGQSAP